MVTIKDVAREAHVAISTVSNVVNNVDNVSEETRKRVLDAVEKLHYVPNFNARTLKANKKNTIGLFLSSLQGDFYRTLIQAVHLQAKMNGYMLNIYVSNDNTSEEVYGMIASSGVEGAIIMNESLTDKYIDRLAKTGIPMVFLERECSGENISSVVIDNYSGAETAMEYLIKQGSRRIGYLHGVESRDDRERYRAYCDVLNKYNIPIDENIIFEGYFEEVIAYSEIRQMFIKNNTGLPDAFFCANDEMALGCIRALGSFGIKVPEQVNVMGFDNIAMAQYYTPSLSTIDSPVEELGAKSTLELIRMLREENTSEGVVTKLVPSLVVRDSCSIRI